MADTLQDIKAAWEKRDARGVRSSSGKSKLDDDQAVYKMADAYVKAHKDDYAGFENLELDPLVKQIDSLRERGDDEGVMKLQVWIWHKFEPQDIGGVYQPKLRTTNG